MFNMNQFIAVKQIIIKSAKCTTILPSICKITLSRICFFAKSFMHAFFGIEYSASVSPFFIRMTLNHTYKANRGVEGENNRNEQNVRLTLLRKLMNVKDRLFCIDSSQKKPIYFRPP